MPGIFSSVEKLAEQTQLYGKPGPRLPEQHASAKLRIKA
jgi:hypothetical protein